MYSDLPIHAASCACARRRHRSRLGRALILVWVSATASLAATELEIGSGAASPGTTMTVPVRLASSQAVTALQFDLVFDASKLSVGTLTAGEALVGHLIDSAAASPGTRRVVVYSRTNQRLGNGPVLNVSFTIPPETPAGAASLTCANVVLANVEGGRVEPVDLVPGQVLIGTLAPRLEALERADDGSVHLILRGVNGLTYRIETSRNLQTWSFLSRHVSDGGPTTVNDASAVNAEQRFYRAVLEP